MIPDVIVIDLPKITSPENLDRLRELRRLMCHILYSPEMCPGADADGEWTMDYEWGVEIGPVTMRKVKLPEAAVPAPAVAAEPAAARVEDEAAKEHAAELVKEPPSPYAGRRPLRRNERV